MVMVNPLGPAGPDKPANFVATSPAKPHADSIDWAADYLLTAGRPRGYCRFNKRLCAGEAAIENQEGR
jgi:hypothetical protein